MKQLNHLLKMGKPATPGEVLREETLPGHQLSVRAAARLLKMPFNRLHDIVNERRTVTPDTAVRLAAGFNTSPEFWMNLQANVDLWHAARKLKPRRARA